MPQAFVIRRLMVATGSEQPAWNWYISYCCSGRDKTYRALKVQRTLSTKLAFGKISRKFLSQPNGA